MTLAGAGSKLWESDQAACFPYTLKHSKTLENTFHMTIITTKH